MRGGQRVRWVRILLLVGLPPLIVGGLAIWNYVLRDTQPLDVVLQEGGLEVSLTTRSAAMDAVSKRVGFRPVVPERFPLQDMRLAIAGSYLPPEHGVTSPAARLLFVVWGQVQQPESVVIFHAGAIESGIMDQARAVGIGVEGAEAWEVGPAPLLRYLVASGEMYVSVLVLSRQEFSDADSLPMLRSIAEQLQ